MLINQNINSGHEQLDTNYFVIMHKYTKHFNNTETYLNGLLFQGVFVFFI